MNNIPIVSVMEHANGIHGYYTFTNGVSLSFDGVVTFTCVKLAMKCDI